MQSSDYLHQPFVSCMIANYNTAFIRVPGAREITDRNGIFKALNQGFPGHFEYIISRRLGALIDNDIDQADIVHGRKQIGE